MSGTYAVDPGRVQVVKDASFRDGLCALAITGEMGEHWRVTSAVSSTDAEMKALVWAMELANDAGLVNVDFLTDRFPMPPVGAPTREPMRLRVRALLEEHPSWRVIPVPRRYVWSADRVARSALRGWRRKHVVTG